MKIKCFFGWHDKTEWLNTEFAEWVWRYCKRPGCKWSQRVRLF